MISCVSIKYAAIFPLIFPHLFEMCEQIKKGHKILKWLMKMRLFKYDVIRLVTNLPTFKTL